MWDLNWDHARRHVSKGSGTSQIPEKAMALYDYRSKGIRTEDRQTITLKFYTAHRTAEEKTIYRTRELSAKYSPNEGFISLPHSILIMCKEFKQESDYKKSNCSKESQIHAGQSIPLPSGKLKLR